MENFVGSADFQPTINSLLRQLGPAPIRFCGQRTPQKSANAASFTLSLRQVVVFLFEANSYGNGLTSPDHSRNRLHQPLFFADDLRVLYNVTTGFEDFPLPFGAHRHETESWTGRTW